MPDPLSAKTPSPLRKAVLVTVLFVVVRIIIDLVWDAGWAAAIKPAS
jgi:hypothetical protein